MKRGKPVNLRPGRLTVVTLPSGEEVSFEPEQAKGHLLLRITAPKGSRIDHHKSDEGTAQQNGSAVGSTAGPELPRLPGASISNKMAEPLTQTTFG